MKNILYTKDYCPYCKKAKGILEKKEIPYTEIDVTHSPELQMEMIARAGGRRTVPQIFINETHVGGCDDLEALYLSGELDKLLEKNKK